MTVSERTEGGEILLPQEDVSGDERDVIIPRPLSAVTYTASAKFGARQWRECWFTNVAVMVLKKVVMITSMPISEISDLLTTRRGPRVPREHQMITVT